AAQGFGGGFAGNYGGLEGKEERRKRGARAWWLFGFVAGNYGGIVVVCWSAVEKGEKRKREGQPGGFRRFSDGEGKRETGWCDWAVVRVFPAGLVVMSMRERIVVWSGEGDPVVAGLVLFG
ncbi:hypothetical protein HAX54_003866, partial [Datura stramonium]|nr:hypothetical protein [Datura stramonium]